jgi:Spy/CpxP family protein refolding chaperone
MKKILILTLILTIGFVFRVYSQLDEMKGLHNYIEKLNLSAEQKKDAEKIRFDLQKQVIAQRAKIATARVEMKQIVKSDIPDKSAIEKKINEIADIGVQMHMIKVNSWFAINKLLSPDQQKIWKEVLEKGPTMKRQMMKRIAKKHFPPKEQDDDVPER